MLKENQLYFASPLDFNDPFDCVLQEHLFDEFREESIELLALMHPQVQPNLITREKTLKLIEAVRSHPKYIEAKVEQRNCLRVILKT